MGEGGFRRGGIPQISGNPAPCPSLSPRKGGAVSPRAPLETPPQKPCTSSPSPPTLAQNGVHKPWSGSGGTEMDFLGNKRTLGLRPPTPKLKRFREHPHPPQGEGSRRDPWSLISTLVLPPATSLCPPRSMPPPLV